MPNPMRYDCGQSGCFLTESPSFGINSALQDVLGRNRSPMDVDGLLEMRGHFLILEYKKGEEALGQGAEIALRQLTRTPRFFVWIIRVDGDLYQVTQLGPQAGQDQRFGVEDWDSFGKRVKDWMEESEKEGW